MVCTAGNCNNGTWCGTEQYAIGYIDKAGDFDCCATVDLANECNFDFDNCCAFSIVASVKTTCCSVNFLVAKRFSGTTCEAGWSLHVATGTGRIRFEMSGGACGEQLVQPGKDHADGNWHTVIATYDGSDNRSGMFVFIDCGGIANSSACVPIGGSILNCETVTLGNNGNGGQGLVGQLDDVQIYNRVLTRDEIRRIFQGRNNRILGIVRNAVTANVNITEAVNKAGTWVRNVASSVNITESRNKAMVLVRNLSQTININESNNRIRALVRNLTQTINITESRNRIVGIIRALPSTINLNDVINSLVVAAAATASIGRTVKRVLGLSNTTTSMDTSSESSSQASIETSKTIKSEGN